MKKKNTTLYRNRVTHWACVKAALGLTPFKPFVPLFYIGKIRIGTPIFHPRRWLSDPNKPGYMMAIPRKVGFDFNPIFYKTKWTDTDYRFEHPQTWSFVLFGLQIAVIFRPPHDTHYWECWLYYTLATNRKESKLHRIWESIGGFPCVWTSSTEGEINYYNRILKKKYLKYVPQTK